MHFVSTPKTSLAAAQAVQSQCQFTVASLAVCLVCNIVGCIKEVNRRWVGLVLLGWVTIGRCVNHLGMLPTTPRSTQPGHPAMSRRNENQ